MQENVRKESVSEDSRMLCPDCREPMTLVLMHAKHMTFPRFHRHLYKEECDEIGGQHDHQGQTAVHGRI